MAHVLYAEKAFLQLAARRLLRNTRDAEARGEKYHDMSSPSPLQCGVRAKFVFEAAPGGYAPVAIIRKNPAFAQEEFDGIAAELLEGPARLRKAEGTDLEYVRADSILVESP